MSRQEWIEWQRQFFRRTVVAMFVAKLHQCGGECLQTRGHYDSHSWAIGEFDYSNEMYLEVDEMKRRLEWKSCTKPSTLSLTAQMTQAATEI